MARRVDPRTRPALLEAASELFYARGLAATAVDDVAEASGLTKPTLYRHFPSKEALVTAYLDDRHDQLDAELRRWVESAPAEQRPRTVVDWLCDWMSRPGFNGCAFVRACAELHHDEEVCERGRRRKRALLAVIEEACRAGGARDPRALAVELVLVVEGATTMAFVTGNIDTAAEAARRLAETALTAAGVEKRRRRRAGRSPSRQETTHG